MVGSYESLKWFSTNCVVNDVFPTHTHTHTHTSAELHLPLTFLLRCTSIAAFNRLKSSLSIINTGWQSETKQAPAVTWLISQSINHTPTLSMINDSLSDIALHAARSDLCVCVCVCVVSPVSKMTYTVSSGTLNPSVPYQCVVSQPSTWHCLAVSAWHTSTQRCLFAH